MSDDYEIGYGKPPKHSQFKKGESGNPSGRPKKRRVEAPHDPFSILAEPVVATVAGQQREMSAFEAGLRKQVTEALKTTSARKLLKGIDLFDKAGLVRRPNTAKHIPILRRPRRWNDKAFRENVERYGPPPWDGPDDGLPMDESHTHRLEDYAKEKGWSDGSWKRPQR